MITGVSASWKTTLVKILKEKYWFVQPLQFTTRPPRTDAEKDEYVFISKPQFLEKLENGDFAEFTFYNGNFYGLTKFFPEGNCVVIVDNNWKTQIETFLRSKEDTVFKSVFIEIDGKTMVDRLTNYRRSSVEEIRQRFEDFKRFSSEWADYVLDGNRSIETVEKKLTEVLTAFGFLNR